MKKILITAIAALSLTACNQKKFHIEGNITDATDSVLYFEHTSLAGPVVLDSVKLDADGHFAFNGKPAASPEFYKLRIAKSIINIPIDSTEQIKVSAAFPSMSTDYTIEGSEECKTVKNLALMQLDLYNKAMRLEMNGNLNSAEIQDSLRIILTAYKKQVKINYIFKNSKSASSYFALFQTLGNSLIFDPRNSKEDINCYAAVASAWDTFYPETDRTQNLHNIALEGIKNTRIMQRRMTKIPGTKVEESGIINITLPDKEGVNHSLTELKGKVVLLDFTAYAIKKSPKRIMMMRELYKRYAGKGLEIYQVSLDEDEHFWKSSCDQLPWICVHDKEGINSGKLTDYRISALPTFFLIDRKNNLYKRDTQIRSLEAEIRKLL